MRTPEEQQLSLFNARRERDRGLARVAENAGLRWSERAHLVVASLPLGAEYIGEDIRLEVMSQIGPPHHHNAWGSVIMTGVRRGQLTPTGEYRAVVGRQSHARRTPVYRRTHALDARDAPLAARRAKEEQ